jgi:putative transcriptional regulator
MNEIQELRAQSGLSQSKFAAKLGIPVRTIQNWEIGHSSPPSYVINMIRMQLRGFGMPPSCVIDSIRMKLEGYDMVNMETVRFISVLNELAEITKTECGNPYILPFSECKPENQNDYLFYNDRNPMKDDEDYAEAPTYYDIVWDKCVDLYHHDIISTYSNRFDGVSIRYRVSHDGNDSWIEVCTGVEYDIIIENGCWYTV